jgi:hypothetical protein
LGVLGASCAKGSDFTGIGGGGGASTGSTSSGAATSSSSVTTTSSSSGAATSSSSSTSSSGSSCPDTPCKLTSPQCGCAAGEACTVQSYAVTCAAPGSDVVDQACGTTTADQCQAGAACVGASATSGQCLEFCETDFDCSSGGICAITLADGPNSTTSIPGVTLCSPHCNPIGGLGCPPGATCELARESSGQTRWFGVCAPSASKTQGTACTQGAGDCALGYTCLDDGTGTDRCLKYCDADLLSGCSGATSCYPLQDMSGLPIVLDGVTIGVCD